MARHSETGYQLQLKGNDFVRNARKWTLRAEKLRIYFNRALDRRTWTCVAATARYRRGSTNDLSIKAGRARVLILLKAASVGISYLEKE